jgi:hypothetical protein
MRKGCQKNPLASKRIAMCELTNEDFRHVSVYTLRVSVPLTERSLLHVRVLVVNVLWWPCNTET